MSQHMQCFDQEGPLHVADGSKHSSEVQTLNHHGQKLTCDTNHKESQTWVDMLNSQLHYDNASWTEDLSIKENM